MLNNLLQILFIMIMIVFAILAVEITNMIHAIIALGGVCVTIGALFWLLNAPYVAVFQLLIYAGAIMVLFLITVMLTKTEEILSDETQLG